MKKLFTLFFALTAFAITAFAQCPSITGATGTGNSNRINLNFANAADATAFFALMTAGGCNSVTADPGGTSTNFAIFGGNNNRIRILDLAGVGGAGDYNGTITFGCGADAFSCSFGTSLPINLTNFTGKKMEKSIRLEWNTESELNNDYFAVERSVDGRNFELLTEVLGKGTTTESAAYAFEDEQPESATNYYRLRQVDYDGMESFSDIITVNFSATHVDLDLYPTLVREEVNLNLTNPENEDVTINILNATGQIVLSKVVNSNNIVTLNLGDLNLSEGMYYAHCRLASRTIVGKFLFVK